LRICSEAGYNATLPRILLNVYIYIYIYIYILIYIGNKIIALPLWCPTLKTNNQYRRLLALELLAHMLRPLEQSGKAQTQHLDCMNQLTSVCMYIYIYTYIYVYENKYKYIYTYISLSLYIYIYIYIACDYYYDRKVNCTWLAFYHTIWQVLVGLPSARYPFQCFCPGPLFGPQ
jgi:hypothetical protein